MTGYITCPEYQESYEYHGNTSIEHTRIIDGHVERQWIYFDSAEEAVTFFNEAVA